MRLSRAAKKFTPGLTPLNFCKYFLSFSFALALATAPASRDGEVVGASAIRVGDKNVCSAPSVLDVIFRLESAMLDHGWLNTHSCVNAVLSDSPSKRLLELFVALRASC